MDESRSRRLRKQVVALVWEILIAVALVSAFIAAAIFYDGHEQAAWMPSPEALRLIGWSLAGFAFGAGYLYLAFRTLRLEHRIADMPQLRGFITFTRRWFISLGISIGFFIFGIWSLWSVLQKYPQTARIWSNRAAALQMITGLLWILGGAGILELRLRMSSQDERPKGLRPSLVSNFLAGGVIVYGATQLVFGFRSLLK
jgi:multisubunit Na+/H+ antiporter MnhB subunit